MGPFALVVTLVVRLVRGRALRRWFKPEPRAIVVGVVLGCTMTALTYPAFSLAARFMPSLRADVRGLYYDASTGSLGVAMAWVCALVVAEELLFRGALLEALEQRKSRGVAFVLSVLSYAFAQLGSGSFIVFLLALVCGSVWTLQRRLTNSLLSTTLAHMIWTQTVILLVPVV
jgi:membrane protease YdiL (CAAX protease family)